MMGMMVEICSTARRYLTDPLVTAQPQNRVEGGNRPSDISLSLCKEVNGHLPAGCHGSRPSSLCLAVFTGRRCRRRFGFWRY